MVVNISLIFYRTSQLTFLFCRLIFLFFHSRPQAYDLSSLQQCRFISYLLSLGELGLLANSFNLASLFALAEFLKFLILTQQHL